MNNRVTACIADSLSELVTSIDDSSPPFFARGSRTVTFGALNLQIRFHEIFAGRVNSLLDAFFCDPNVGTSVPADSSAEIHFIVDDEHFALIRELAAENDGYEVETFADSSHWSYESSGIKAYFRGSENASPASDAHAILTSGRNCYLIVTTGTREPEKYLLRCMREMIYLRQESMGYQCVHSAAVKIGHTGIILVGEKGKGKTTLLSHLMSHPEAAYISNDRLFVRQTPEGTEIITFPMFIKLSLETINANPFLAEVKGDRLFREQAGEELRRRGLKLEMTPSEYGAFFSRPVVENGSLDLILLPHIEPGRHGVEIVENPSDGYRCLLMNIYTKHNEALRNVIFKDMFTAPRAEMSAEKLAHKLITDHRAYVLRYGYETSSDEIHQAIDQLID